MRITTLAACCVVLVLGSSQAALADPVYIKGGYYVIGSTGDPYQFDVPNPFVVNPGVLITGSAPSVPGISELTCFVCDPGQTYQIGRQTAGEGPLGKADLGTGTEISGMTTRNYAFSGWLTFIPADPITLPAAGSSSISFAVPLEPSRWRDLHTLARHRHRAPHLHADGRRPVGEQQRRVAAVRLLH